MDFTAKKIGAAGFFDLAGKLTVDADTEGLQDAVCRLVRNGVRIIVLDLARLSRLDCAGIGRLIALRNRVHRFGGAFGLLNVAPRHRRMLELLHVPDVCRVIDTAEDTRVGDGVGPRRTAYAHECRSDAPSPFVAPKGIV